MDPAEKKRLANEKRLKAIAQWHKKPTQQISPKISVDDFDFKNKKETKNTLKLFDSDGEDNADDDFSIRPQFEGQNGLQNLEMSSQLSSRFKLDERFKDDNEPSEVTVDEANEEKIRNIKILESILGHEVSKKYLERKEGTQKRCIKRFDPDNESASKYIKINDISEGSKKKSHKKHREKEDAVEIKEENPISNERYIEVTSNLKDLLGSSSHPFSLTSKFSSNQEDDEINNDFSTPDLVEKEVNPVETDRNIQREKYNFPQQTKYAFEKRNIYSFFVLEDDPRLKEGVEFFKRPKSFEEISEEWGKRKESVLELFKNKKKSFLRGYTNKRPTTQGKRTFIKK